MASIIQQLKGTAAEVAAKVYGQGVLVWNETAKRWHGGDGATAGGIAMARYDERNDGSLGYEQRVETAASNSVTVADIGRLIVGNRASAIAFNLDPAASLTGKFVAVFKNINTGPMTIVPNGTQLIDGVNAAVTVPTGSSVVIKGDGTSFRTVLSNGDVTGAAINGAAPLTGANLADNDKIGVYDTSAAALAGMTVAELVAGIFKTARKIANGYFLSSFRIWDTADSTKGLAFVLTAIATGQVRNMILPNRDVDLSKEEAWELIGTFSQTAVANAPVTGLLDNVKYNRFNVEIDELIPVTNSVNLNLEVSTDNGATWLTTSIYTTKIVRWDDAGVSNGGGNNLSAMVVANTVSNIATQFLSGKMEIYHDKDNNVRISARFEYFSTGGFLGSDTSARILTGAKINAIRFRTSSGNIAAVNGRVYGRVA